MPRAPLSPAERVERARLAANTRWSRVSDRLSATAPGRRAMLEHFERQVDPEGILPSEERVKRAENARKAQLARARLKASRLARQRREAVQGIRQRGAEDEPAEPNGVQLQEQLLRIISEGALCEEQLIRISELLRAGARPDADAGGAQ